MTSPSNLNLHDPADDGVIMTSSPTKAPRKSATTPKKGRSTSASAVASTVSPSVPKPIAKKATTKKSTASKTVAKKATAPKTVAKKATTKRAPVKKAPKVAAVSPHQARNPPLNLPKDPFLFEILDLAHRTDEIEGKANVLRTYRCNSLVQLCVWNYDEILESALPEGEMPNFEEEGCAAPMYYQGYLESSVPLQLRKIYKEATFNLGTADPTQMSSLRKNDKNFFRFVKGGDSAITNRTRERLFLNLYKSLHPLEGQILALVKDKKLHTVYDIPWEAVKLAYPDIRWNHPNRQPR